jgi:ribonuclease Y
MTDKNQKLQEDLVKKLEKASNMTQSEARAELMRQVRKQLTQSIAKEIKEAEEKIKIEAEKRAREIVVEAMRHGATDWVSEFTVSTIQLEDESIKARIIGKEGRNIRAFERATNVDVNLDEEGVITISSFDAIRREVARIALNKLIKDGRIQPARIEEIVEQTKKEIQKEMLGAGEKFAHEARVFSLPTEIIALLGKFKYRFSYGQNLLKHTLEETKIGVALAQELKVNVDVVRLGCLLHDIGKVIHDEEGSHVEKGVAFLKKHNMPKAVVDCVEAHHEDIPFPSLEAIIVYIADAISGARPGARYEDYGEYVKRLKNLEDIAKKHEGIKDAFAISAGREVRVIVNPEDISDAQATVLAQDIKKEIEEKMIYPGQVKVTVIREFRAVEVAK